MEESSEAVIFCVIWMAAFSVWAPVTFSKALIKFSKELLKNFWPKKDFFYCDLVFEEVYYCDLVFWVRKNDSTTCQ